jgi:putative inorganic carbon (HCO3(-)) transporter
MIVLAAALMTAWGALAFGAVYPWAYWPLFAAAGVAGLAGIVARPGRASVRWPLVISVAAVLASIGLQLVPLPARFLAAISPNADRLLRQLNVAYAAGAIASHPLSIEPMATGGRLIELIAFALFLCGLSRALTARRSQLLANAIIGLGALVALIGIVQKSSGTDHIYGFWAPYDHPYQIFGPFVNKNHFAGWMLMPFALGIGVLCGRVTTAMSNVRSDWRSRAIWWSSPDASQMLLVAGAIVVIAFSIMLTRSRSGITSAGVVVVLAVVAVIMQTRSAGRQRRGVVTAVVVAVLASAGVLWAGTQPLLARLQSEPGLNGRLDAWRAAVHIASDFPVAGTGLNTFTTAMLFYQLPPLSPRWEFAHNDYLQLLAEGGVLVVVPFVVCALVIVRKSLLALRQPQSPATLWLRLGAGIGLLGVGCQEAFDFSLQLPGISALFSVLLAFTLFDVERS